MTFSFAVLIMVQQLQGTASIDRTDPMVGDVISLTIRVESAASQPVSIGSPVLSALEVRGTREESRVSVRDGVPMRVTTRTLQLAATEPGAAVVGSIRVRQGSETVDTDPLTIRVLPVSSVSSSRLEPRVRAVLERSAPPRGEEDVTVGVVTMPESVVLGEQLDVIVAAWFPRAIRRRLRMPPTLSSPPLEGAWLYRQYTPPGIAASRRVDREWYDLFVAHVVAFPLLPGSMNVGPASVAYDLPVTFSFLTRELRHVVQSESLTVTVMNQPRAGRPAGFTGPAAGALRFSLVAEPRDVAVGEAATVTAVLAGQGNVALWPEPDLDWPPAVRVYPLDPEVDLERSEGWVAGTKRFRYLVLPDSIGAHVIPAPSVTYYDVNDRRYIQRRAGPVEIVARAGQGAMARAAPPPLSSRHQPLMFGVPSIPLWAVIALALLPPLVFGCHRFVLALRPHTPTYDRGEVSPLQRLERDFREAVRHLVSGDDLGEGDGLANALRAAGVETAVAEHAARVRDRLRHAVYGPDGASDPDELAAEVRSTLEALRGEKVGSGASRLGGVVLLVAAVALGSLTTTLQAQRLTAEDLFERGAFRAAADSFAARVAAHPESARDWYNLGSAYYRLRDDTRAKASWIRAARLAPRYTAISQALRLLPPPDRATARLLRVAPLTPAEMLLIALVSWGVGWSLLTLRAGRKLAVVSFGLAIAFAAAAWTTEAHYAGPVALMRAADTPLRVAPYGSARPRLSLEAGVAVEVSREEGGWVLATRGEVQGWLLVREVEPL